MLRSSCVRPAPTLVHVYVFVRVYVYLCVCVYVCAAGNVLARSAKTPPFTLPFNISMVLFFLCAGSTANLPLIGNPALMTRPSNEYLEGWEQVPEGLPCDTFHRS